MVSMIGSTNKPSFEKPRGILRSSTTWSVSNTATWLGMRGICRILFTSIAVILEL